MPHEMAIAATEMRPYCQVGDLAVFVDSLARELRKRDHGVTVFLPRYGEIESTDTLITRRTGSVPVIMGEDSIPAEIRLTEVPSTGVRIVWIGNQEYFGRAGLYVDPQTGQEWDDNAARWIFFSKAIVASLAALDIHPDLIHLNDHQTALVPLLLREGSDTPEHLCNLGTLLSIHEIGTARMGSMTASLPACRTSQAGSLEIEGA